MSCQRTKTLSSKSTPPSPPSDQAFALPVRQPSRKAGNDKKDREEVSGESHGPVDEARVEVHVWVQLPLNEVLVLQSRHDKQKKKEVKVYHHPPGAGD